MLLMGNKYLKTLGFLEVFLLRSFLCTVSKTNFQHLHHSTLENYIKYFPTNNVSCILQSLIKLKLNLVGQEVFTGCSFWTWMVHLNKLTFWSCSIENNNK